MSNGSLISYSRSHNNNNSYIVLLTVFPLVVSGGDCTAPTGSGPPSSLSHQDWLTPENKQWPGSGRANEVQGDREVIATRYQVLISPSKKTAPTKPAKK